MAVAAGANMILTPEPYIGMSKLKMISPESRSRMWDAKVQGYARREGVAALVLKKLSDALRDGDHIESIIREVGVNQDGRTKEGITMPSQHAQRALIEQTYAKAGLDPRKEEDRCQFFEARGTGTAAGDPRVCEASHRIHAGMGRFTNPDHRLGSRSNCQRLFRALPSGPGAEQCPLRRLCENRNWTHGGDSGHRRHHEGVTGASPWHYPAKPPI